MLPFSCPREFNNSKTNSYVAASKPINYDSLSTRLRRACHKVCDIKYVVLCMHAPTTKYNILYVVLRVQGLPQSTYDIKYVVLFTCVVLGLCWWYGSKRESPPAEGGAPRYFMSYYDIKYVVLFTCVLGLCWWYGSKRESPPELRGAEGSAVRWREE